MRLRVPASFLAVLLAAVALPAGEDFPFEDHSVWLFVERGLKNQAADLQLAKAPESPETVALLLDAYRPGDALMVLRRIVERWPERMGAAFQAASANWHRFNDDGRGYPSVLREIVARAQERLSELPREQAAEAAWYLRFLALPVPGQTPVPWGDQLRAFLAEYAGTEAALIAELRLLDEGGDIHARIAAFEAFARAHAGTAIGAQALYTAAMHSGFNAREPRGADPTERLLRLAALARELQSGTYPDCEWVRRAPRLVVGFFASQPQYNRLSPDSPSGAEARELRTRAKPELALVQAGPEASEESKRAALAALESLAAERYGFSVFAAQVARATLHSIVGSTSRAAELMVDALAQWHEHGAALFARRSATALQQDVMDIRDAVFHPNANWPPHEFRHLRSSDSPPAFFVATPDVRVKLHDDSDVRVEAASRLSARQGALLLDDEQIAVLERILTGLGGTKRRTPQAVMETPNQPIGGVEDIQKLWNRFFTMGPGHWGGWILQTFPDVTEVTFIDAARTRGAARIRTGYQGSTQLLTKGDGTWKVSGASGHWVE